MKSYDYIIIGTGQAVSTLLGGLLKEDKKIAVIEAHKIGGSCVNYGCTPTKALVASAKAFHTAGQGEQYGFNAQPELNYQNVKERMNEIRNASNKGLKEWIENEENIDLFKARASFDSEKVILVNGEKISAEKIFINVGTRAFSPPIEGIESVNHLDSEALLDLNDLPPELIILGGGYVGVEFAQIYQRFGSQVTLVQRGEQLMPAEDKDIAEEIKKILEEEGVRVLCDHAAKKVSATKDGIQLIAEHENKMIEINGSHLLLATGRIPNSDTLKLENTAIETYGKGYISVDEYCRTKSDGVFALGDVNGKGAFTHTSVNDAEIVLDFLQNGHRKISDRIPVYALFSDPPLGRVGLSEKEALKKGYKVLRAIMPMTEISRAKEMSQTNGFAKLLVDAETDLILGASILGVGGDEIINMFAAIMHSGIPCKRYREVVLVHPTVSELMPWALDSLEAIN